MMDGNDRGNDRYSGNIGGLKIKFDQFDYSSF